MSVRNIGQPQVAFLFSVLLFMSIFLPTAGPVNKVPSIFFPERYSWEFVLHGVVGAVRLSKYPDSISGFSPSKHEDYLLLTY